MSKPELIEDKILRSMKEKGITDTALAAMSGVGHVTIWRGLETQRQHAHQDYPKTDPGA